MTQNFTHEDLVRFIYKECSAEEAVSVKRAILSNTDVAAEYHAMLTVKEDLDTEFLQPHQTSINIILQHAMQEVEH
ncbi:MAG TPA: hypothetical protein VEY71_07645 [Chitinophagales bacterium]|nr:hypothetical protein [Chitinophagales bacterium]